MPIDIGDSSKRVLLVGAGFSRNWGGRLAIEVWQDVFGHAAVKSRPAVIELLRGEASFEAALEIVRTDGAFSAEDRLALETAIADCFERMDRQFCEPNAAVSIYTINSFIGRFCPGPVGQPTGYVFSLNQDLLLERKFGTQPDVQKLSIPGIRWQQQPPPFPAGAWPIPEAILDDPRSNAPILNRHFNLIKLHGSMNWRSGDGSRSMIVGGGKPASIAREPLLAWYQEVFEAVLSAGGVRLMVIGYGWSDEHVNAVIANAAKNHDLGVYFWDVSDPRGTLPSKPYGDVILKAMIGLATRPMHEVMPAPQNPQTQEYARIVTELF